MDVHQTFSFSRIKSRPIAKEPVQYYIENVRHDFVMIPCPLRNGNFTTIVVRKNCDGFYGLKKPSSSEYNHGSDSVILNNSKTSSSVLYQGGCSVWGEIFQIYSRLTTLGKMGLGLVYPPMATLEHPAHASRSGLCKAPHQQPG